MLIREEDVVPLIDKYIQAPDLRQVLNTNTSSIFNQVGCFADYTRRLAENGELQKMASCFMVADSLLQNGCATVKIAIENVFMYTIGLVLDSSATAREKIKAQLTPGLLHIYNHQIQTSGI